MELFAVYGRSAEHPASWAEARQDEGWDGLGAPDHILSSGLGWPHPFFVLGVMAAATDRVTLTPAVGNNLLRSPVEFAQLSLTAQHMSGGRYEAAIGAGWARDEIVGIGLDYPEPPERARRYREAVLIIKELLSQGSCAFEGEFYRIDMPVAGPAVDAPPPIVAALGGPWTIANIGPLVDRIELIAGHALSKGEMDVGAMASFDLAGLQAMIDSARRANPAAAVGAAFYVAAGENAEVEQMAAAFPSGSVYGGLAGPPGMVAERIRALGEALDLDRITVVPGTTGSIENIGPALFG